MKKWIKSQDAAMRRTCTNLKNYSYIRWGTIPQVGTTKADNYTEEKYTGIERRDRPAADSGSHGLNKYGQ